MKRISIALLSLGLLLNAACQENSNLDEEKKAIMKVLLEEGKLFSEFDMEGLAALHITDESATRYDGVEVYSGWEDIASLLKSYMVNIAESEGTDEWEATNDKENAVIKVTGNTAWVICDNIWHWEYEGKPQSDTNKQIAFFEKIDGKWMISFNAFVGISE
jgi:hypothetical protein